MTKEQERMLLDNSVERVINTSMRLAEACTKHRDPVIQELADVNLDDWDNLKVLVTLLWNDARNEVFKARQEAKSC